MNELSRIFKNNQSRADARIQEDPQYFERHVGGQSPDYLWIGCSDSRVPPNEITGLGPGELFVHRNIANAVVHSDLNCQSVVQYAVEVLRVGHIFICGHYGCGGIKAAMEEEPHGLIDHWLDHIRDPLIRQSDFQETGDGEQERWDTMCELNVKAQVIHTCNNPFVRGAWRDGRNLTVHGLIYALNDGLLKDLGLSVEAPGEVPALPS